MLNQIIPCHVEVQNRLTGEVVLINVCSPSRFNDAVSTAKADILAALGKNNRRIYPRWANFTASLDAETALENISITAKITYI